MTPDQIDRVVAVFYAAIRRHEVLDPVFAALSPDWPEHEEKDRPSSRKNAIPCCTNAITTAVAMQAHMRAGDVHAQHFAPWLMLFDETLRRTLPPETAEAWSQLAHRIGAGLRMGVEDLRERMPGPPVLR